MQKNFKSLKFYNWLSKISPLFFELHMKLFYDYDFFKRAEQSLKFTHLYWAHTEITLENVARYTMPNLLKYDELPLFGDAETFYQLMLKRAIFHWKFIPWLLLDLFKAYPLFEIPFAEPEISIFDSWLELSTCIEELYTIILENHWDHVLPEPNGLIEHVGPNAYVMPHLCEGFKVESHFLYEKHIVGVSDLIKKITLETGIFSGIDLDSFKDPNDQEHVIYFNLVKIFLSIHDLKDLISYWEKVTTLRTISSKHSFDFYDHFPRILRKNLLITNQLLAVNPFFDFSKDREKFHAAFLKLSPERQLALKTFNYVPAKKKRKYSSYEEWFALCTDFPKAISYEESVKW